MSVHLALTGPPSQARYAHVAWDSCPALLALLAFKVLSKTTGIYQQLSVKRRLVIFKMPVGHLKSSCEKASLKQKSFQLQIKA